MLVVLVMDAVEAIRPIVVIVVLAGEMKLEEDVSAWN